MLLRHHIQARSAGSSQEAVLVRQVCSERKQAANATARPIARNVTWDVPCQVLQYVRSAARAYRTRGPTVCSTLGAAAP